MRPGIVYRLYSQNLYERFQPFDTSEVRRTPLQEIIIQLKAVAESAEAMDEGVSSMLEDLIEPPDLLNIDKSFEFLFDAGMIDEPSDRSRLTPMGKFSSELNVGVELSRLISLGVMIGVGEEVSKHC